MHTLSYPTITEYLKIFELPIFFNRLQTGFPVYLFTPVSTTLTIKGGPVMVESPRENLEVIEHILK
jgi:hypothetical protein